MKSPDLDVHILKQDSVPGIIRAFLNNSFSGSYEDLKALVLFIQIGVAFMFVPMLYLGIACYYGLTNYIVLFSSTLLTCIISLGLVRLQVYVLAKAVWMVTLLAVIFFVSGESPETGAFFYLILAGMLGFMLFGYRQRIIAVAFGFLTIGVFFLGYFRLTVPLMTPAEKAALYTNGFVHYIFIQHFLITLSASCLFTFLLVRANSRAVTIVLSSNAELAKTNEALDRLVYSAAHDLKSPLNSLKALIELSRESQSETERTHLHGYMRDCVANLSSFVTDAIDFTRVIKKQVNCAPVDVRTLINEVLSDISFLPDYARVDVSVSADHNLVAQWDKFRIKSIFSNLITNSIKYHDFSKETRFVNIACERQGDKIRCVIRDNGRGIEMSRQSDVFKMFYRGSSEIHGNGLGLYIVKETIDLLQGTISMTSEYSEGTSFTFVVPG